MVTTIQGSGFLLNLEFSYKAGCPASVRDVSVSTSPALGLQTLQSPAVMCAGDPTLGPHLCPSGHLPSSMRVSLQANEIEGP